MKRFFLGILLLAAELAARGQSVFINEIVASSGTAPLDEEGDKPDWIELHNPGAEPVNLLGWGLSDNAGRPFKWIFGNASIGAGEFMVVFASGKDRHPEAPVALEPNAVPNLKVWLDAGRFNASDAAQARRVGEAIFVRRANDASNNQNHATQATDGNQPMWIANGFNGRPVFRFDGTTDSLTLPRSAGTNSFSVFAVFRTAQTHEIDNEDASSVGGVSGQRYLFGAQHGGDFAAGAGLSVGVNGVSVYEHGSGYMPATAVSSAAIGNSAAVVSYNYTERRPEIEINSMLARSGVFSGRAQVMAPVMIGAGDYGAFNGDLAEVLIFDRALSVAERRGIAGYLMAKYNIPLVAPHHTNWQLSADGEEVALTRPDGSQADYFEFGIMPRDVSFGRQPDDVGEFFYFAQPTPRGPNTTPGASEFLLPPAFSHPAGFHQNTISLTISSPTPGAEIRYTLDGSEPNAGSLLYTTPLSLSSRAAAANVLSTIPTSGDWAPPAGTVFKGWVVRAGAFKAGALPSAVTTATYFIDPRGRGRYSVPVISLATDRANFFDNQIGIYVPGNTGANYSQRGEGWERPIHVEMVEGDNRVAFAQDADVKIHGNTSQNFRIKGIDLDGTGGKGRGPFLHRIFPNRARTEFEHFLLRPSGHDHHMAFMRDEFMQAIAAETGAESQGARACVVFLNGEYWGLHYLKEKEDAEFVSFYGNTPIDGMDFLEGYAAPRAGDTAHYNAMIQFMANSDLSRAENYAHVKTQMEVANYMDYKACEVFFYRWDIGNHRFWRPKTPDGRYRWLQFDNDVGWGGFWTSYPAWTFNMLSAVLTPDGGLNGHANETTTFLLRRLLTNAEFKRDFINRFADLLNTSLLPARTIAKINEHAAVLEPEMAEHTARWRAPESLASWRGFVQQLRDYANNRPASVRQHIIQQFGLQGTAQVTASISKADAGTAWVSTVAVTNTTTWTGTYFRGNPLVFRAEPRAGHRFLGWLGTWQGALNVNPLTLALNGNMSIVAQFAADSELAARFTGTQIVPGGARLAFQGAAGRRYVLESSGDLMSWAAAGEYNAGADGSGSIDVTGDDARFWQLRFVE